MPFTWGTFFSTSIWWTLALMRMQVVLMLPRVETLGQVMMTQMKMKMKMRIAMKTSRKRMRPSTITQRISQR